MNDRGSTPSPVTAAPGNGIAAAPPDTEAGVVRPRVFFPRLLIGLVVLICTEVFSGASISVGLWNPWTWLVTFWLYFAHFFFFTTLAVLTGRTSFWSLYLWGVLFGLYESWITKVIWHGYSGDGKFVLGNVGPYGFSEFSMVVLFQPLMAFIVPLAVACLLVPPLRRYFPDLAWFTGRSRGARVVQIYITLSCGTILGMNSGGPLNLALNLALLVGLLLLLLRLARRGLAESDGRSLVTFGRWGFAGLCAYLGLLYGVTYFHLRPEGLPSVSVQLLTFAFYAVAIAGLRLNRRRAPLPDDSVSVESRERSLVLTVLGSVLGMGLVLSLVAGSPALYLPIMVSFVIWTPLGLVLLVAALARGIIESLLNRTRS